MQLNKVYDSKQMVLLSRRAGEDALRLRYDAIPALTKTSSAYDANVKVVNDGLTNSGIVMNRPAKVRLLF